MSPSPLAGCMSTSRSSLAHAAIPSGEMGERPTCKVWRSPTLWRWTLPSAVDAIEGQRAGDGACARPPVILIPTRRVTAWATRLYVSTTEHRDCGPFSCATSFEFSSCVTVTAHGLFGSEVKIVATYDNKKLVLKISVQGFSVRDQTNLQPFFLYIASHYSVFGRCFCFHGAWR